jgi:hypothetical protein
MDFLLIVMIGMPLGLGIVWQVYVFKKHDKVGPDALFVSIMTYDWSDKMPARIIAALIASHVIFLGVLGFYAIAVFDEHKTFSFLEMVGSVGRALVLCGFLIIKSYFGPVVVGYMVASSAYFGYE